LTLADELFLFGVLAVDGVEGKFEAVARLCPSELETILSAGEEDSSLMHLHVAYGPSAAALQVIACMLTT